METSLKVLDHFSNPCNVGVLNKNDQMVGTGITGNSLSNTFIQIQIKIDPTTNFIEDAKFKAHGCPYTIAACSFSAKYLIGQHFRDALLITHSQISDELSLPSTRLYCSIIVEDAIKLAVADYLNRNP